VVARDLPNGFVHGKVDARDYSLVRSRTAIPRQDRTLRKLPSVAIYPAHTQSTAPIAWGFLGLDASLTTLHVEPEYRGLGLAKSLSLWLFLHDMETYWKHNPPHITSDRYAHADVATDNNSSQGVCKSLGGKWHFLVYWVRVDVGKA
jgi:ribosomal protein S18 acetylase RimI-like enzyme